MPKSPRTFTLGAKRAPRFERERKRRIDRKRGSATERGYGGAWPAFRVMVLVERGLRCEGCGCLGVLREAEANELLPVLELDHIETIADRPDLRLDRDNVRSLCRPCHARRTARDQGFARPRR